MSVANALGTVTLQYKADTSDAVENINRLSAVQKKNAQDAVNAQKEVGKSLQDYVVMVGAAGAGIAAGFAVAKSSFDEYTRTVSLQGAVSASTLDAVTRASDGLRSKMQLLTLAQAAEQGAFKLTARESEQVVKGMRALEAQGYKTEVVTQKITKALQEGAIGQLQEFGIQLQSTGTIAGDKALVLAALAKEVKDVGGNFASAGDDVTRAGVKWEDTLHGVKMAIGELVIKMGPLLSSLAATVETIAQIAAYASKLPGVGGGGGGISLNGMTGKLKWLNPLGAGGNAALALYGYASSGNGGPASGAGTLYMNDAQQADWDAKQRAWFADGSMNNDSPYLRQLMAEASRKRREMAQGLAIIQGRARWLGAGIGKGLGIGEKAPARGRGGKRTTYETSREENFDAFDMGSMGFDASSLGTSVTPTMSSDVKRLQDKMARDRRALDRSMRRGAEMNDSAAQHEGMLAETFGPLEEFDKYKTAWQGLETVVSAGFDAWISGSKSVGEALKEALSGFAKQLAGEAILQSLRHAAAAVGSLAYYNYDAAAKHGAAALKWAGVAAAAGIVAHVTSGGGASTGGAGGAGGFRSRPAPTPEYLGSQRTFVIGDHASDGSPRRRAREQRRLMNQADKYAPPTGSRHG